MQEICANRRIYKISELRGAIIAINADINLQRDKSMRYFIPKLYHNNLSSLMAKTDNRTFYHFMTLLKIFKIRVNDQEYEKLEKVAIKRLNRVNNGEERQNLEENDKYNDTPFMELLKVLDSFSFLKGMGKDRLRHLCDQTQRIIETKVMF